MSKVTKLKANENIIFDHDTNENKESKSNVKVDDKVQIKKGKKRNISASPVKVSFYRRHGVFKKFPN